MSLRRLKIFVTVADCKTMRKAAEVLYISQPAISQAIHELEADYGVRLFDRLSQRLYLTQGGQTLLSYARFILETEEKCREALQNTQAHPLLRVGASVSVGTVLIKPLVEALNNLHPQMDVRVVIDNTSVIEQLILNGEADAALVEGNVESAELIQETVCQDEMVCVVGKKHALYGKPGIQPEELIGQPLISREAGSKERNQLLRLLEDRRVSLKTQWSSTSTEAIKGAVSAGLGVAVLSRMLVEKELNRGELFALRIQGITAHREIKLIYHKNKYLSEGLLLFRQICLASPAKHPIKAKNKGQA